MRRYFSLGLILIFCAVSHAQEVDWPAYGGSDGGGHYSPATQINRENVKRLQQAWVHRSGDFKGGVQSLTEVVSEELQSSRPTSFIGTPIVTQGKMFYCTPYNRVFALNPATGEELWVFDPEVDMTQENVTN